MQIDTDIDDDIYTGVWVDHSHGKVLGALLTLDRRSGALLIAFLAVYVGAAGTSFWKIMRYAAHRTLFMSMPSDGVYHQRQAVLRNSELPYHAAYQLSCMLFAWRKSSTRLKRRILPIALLAVVVWLAFLVASKPKLSIEQLQA